MSSPLLDSIQPEEPREFINAPPSSAADRIDATWGELTAPGNWYRMSGELQSRHDKVIDQIYNVTGQRVKNPYSHYDLRPDQSEYIEAGGQIDVIRANRMKHLVEAANAARELDPSVGKPDEIEAYINAEQKRAEQRSAELVGTGAGISNFVAGAALGTILDPIGALTLLIPVSKIPYTVAQATARASVLNVLKEGGYQAGINAAAIAASVGIQHNSALDHVVKGEAFLGQELPDQLKNSTALEEIMTAGGFGFVVGAAFRGIQLKAMAAGKRYDEVFTPNERAAADALETANLYGPSKSGVSDGLEEEAKKKITEDLLKGRGVNTAPIAGKEPAPLAALAADIKTEDGLVARAVELNAAFTKETDPIKKAEIGREVMQINKQLVELNIASRGAAGDAPPVAAGEAGATLPGATAATPRSASPGAATGTGETAQAPARPRLVVARRTKEGEIIMGKPGELHSDLYAEHGNIEDDIDTNRMGFATPDGKFLTRKQAAAWVKKNDPTLVKHLDDTSVVHASGYDEAIAGRDAENPAPPPPPPTASPRRRAKAEKVTELPDSKVEKIALEADPVLKKQVEEARANLAAAEKAHADAISARGDAPVVDKPKTKAQIARETKAAKAEAEARAKAGDVPKAEVKPVQARDVATEAEADRLDELRFAIEGNSPTSAEHKAAKKELAALQSELFARARDQNAAAKVEAPKVEEPKVEQVVEEDPNVKRLRAMVAKSEERLQKAQEVGSKTPTTARALQDAELALDRNRNLLNSFLGIEAKADPASLAAAEVKLNEARIAAGEAERRLAKKVTETRASLKDQATVKTEAGVKPDEAVARADAALAREEQAAAREIEQAASPVEEIPAPIEMPKPKTEGEAKIISKSQWDSLQEKLKDGTVSPDTIVSDGMTLGDLMKLADLNEKDAQAIVSCATGSIL